jgi:O-antigen ligase
MITSHAAQPLPLSTAGAVDGGRWKFIVPALWGAWVALTPIASFIASPARQPIYLYESVDTRSLGPAVLAATYAVLALGVIPLIATLLTQRMQPTRALPFLAVALPILIMISASLLGSTSSRDVVIIASGTYMFGLIAVFVAQESDETLIYPFLIAVAVVHTLSILVAFADGNFVLGRFQGRIGSNFWGSIGAFSLLAGLIAQRWWTRGAIALVCLAAILLGQNRSSLISLIAGGGLIALVAFINAGRERRLLYAALGLLAGIALVFLLPTLLDKVFLVSDVRRGIASGGTGRSVAWAEALNVFLAHPLMGVGYRHHEQFIAVASSAHQAYLATLADMGLFGLFAYILFIFSALAVGFVQAVRYRSWPLTVLTGIVFAYATQGFFEQRAINFANSVSLLMLFSVALILRPRPAAGAGRQPLSSTIPQRSQAII